LCSNIGDLPQRLLTFGPHRCLGVAARAIHAGLTVGARPRTRLSGYLCRIGARYTLCLVALDPPGIESAEGLAESTGRVAAGLAVPLTFRRGLRRPRAAGSRARTPNPAPSHRVRDPASRRGGRRPAAGAAPPPRPRPRRCPPG